MDEGRIGTKGAHHKIALGLLAIALFVRLLVPAGWMPAAGQGYAIMLCTDMGAAIAWVDEDGNVRKDAPAPSGTPDHHCTFAGFSAALTAPDWPGSAIALADLANPTTKAAFDTATIGHGLAAPPPPPTGPPTANL